MLTRRTTSLTLEGSSSPNLRMRVSLEGFMELEGLEELEELEGLESGGAGGTGGTGAI